MMMLNSCRKNVRGVGSFSGRLRQTVTASHALGRWAPQRYQFVLLAGAIFSLNASAAQTDTLQPFIGVSYSHDDNLFRVLDGQPAFDNTLGDSSRVVTAGMLFDKTYGMQHLSFQAGVADTKFSHFNQLDYKGKSLTGTWNWKLGTHIDGAAGVTYSQVLAPYTDFRSSERNLRTSRRGYIDGGWRFHPRWRARASVTQDLFSYDLSSQRINNRTEDAGVVGIDYLAPSGSTIGLQVRKVEGKYPNPRPSGQVLVDDRYDQQELKLRIDWHFSKITDLQFIGGSVKRTRVFFAEGDDSGTNGRFDFRWAPRANVQFTSSLWREFGAVENGAVRYSVNIGESAGMTWDKGAKLRFEGQFRREKRDFKGLGIALNALNNYDVTRVASVRATYSPTAAVVLSTSLSHEARTALSIFEHGRYRSNSVAVNAQIHFPGLLSPSVIFR